MPRTFRYRNHEFTLDDSQSSYIDVTFDEQKGRVWVHRGEVADRIVSGSKTEANLLSVCDHFIREHAKVNAHRTDRP